MKYTDMYTIEVAGKKFIYSHKPSYDKALEQVNKHLASFEHAVYMLNRASERVKEHIARGNSLDDERGQELERRYIAWESLIDDALKGKPSTLFIALHKFKKSE